MTGDQIKRTGAYRGFGIRDGHGIMFVSNTGDICPAGFLPLVAGNVRKDRVADIYRNSPVFQALHDPSQFEGRCGYCEYHAICGGSRDASFRRSRQSAGRRSILRVQPHSRPKCAGQELAATYRIALCEPSILLPETSAAKRPSRNVKSAFKISLRRNPSR